MQQQKHFTSKTVLSIPIPHNLSQSLQMMSDSQIKINIAQLHLLSMHNQEVRKQTIELMKSQQFYYSVIIPQFSQYRYLLRGLYIADKTEQNIETIKDIERKFDDAFVNSFSDIDSKTQLQEVIIIGKIKESKAGVISLRQNFFDQMNNLSQDLKGYEGQASGKIQFFKIKLKKVNQLLGKYLKENTNQKGDHQGEYLWKVPYEGKLQNIKQIQIGRSKFYETKNRNPILLDFGFGKFIYKNDDQLSNQIIAMSLIKYLNLTIQKGKIIQYDIIPEKDGALYQFVDNSMTISQIKSIFDGKILPYIQMLERQKDEISPNITAKTGFKELNKSIRENFVQSYAAFCFIQYVLQLKDRNNNNIMIRNDGSIFHIDLSFIFQSKPGGISFQSAPFKLTSQYIDIMQGYDSDLFNYYETLLVQMFTTFYSYQDQFFYKMSILAAREKEIRCFNGFSVDKYKKRFVLKLSKVKQFVEELIDQSNDNWKTKKYDTYQFKTNGILP